MKSCLPLLLAVLASHIPAAAASAPERPTALAMAQAGNAPAADPADAKVPKAGGPDARTVAEVNTRAAELKDKPVVIRARVVKYNPGIMGKNWVHLRDGSGSAIDRSNDILVTTQATTKVGDIVTVKGTVRTDRDFGAGYAYKVLVEDASFQ